jgi:hypothetical protein
MDRLDVSARVMSLDGVSFDCVAFGFLLEEAVCTSQSKTMSRLQKHVEVNAAEKPIFGKCG